MTYWPIIVLRYVKVSCRICLHLRNVNKPQIRIRHLGNFNIRRMSNVVKLFKITQNSNSNFVTSLDFCIQSTSFVLYSFLQWIKRSSI